MGASQLGIYNGALRYLQQRKLKNLQENREPRRYMDDEWADNNIFCIESGNWNFAMRRVRLEASETLIPNFGLAYAFPKPLDWNHTFQISDNEDYNPLLRAWTDQNGFWYTDISPIYVDYVSIDPNYGLNLGLWTQTFTDYVQARLAWLCAPRILQDDAKFKKIDAIMKRAKATAINKDSQDLPPGFLPYGSWVMSRAPRGSVVPLGNPYAGSNS